MTRSLNSFRHLLGSRVWRLFCGTIITGILWFFSESLFVYVLQAFMVSLGLIEIDKTMMTKAPWLVDHALLFLLVFGALRGLVTFLRGYFVALTTFRFVVEQRKKLFSLGLRFAQRIATKEIIALFGDITNNSGTLVQYLALFMCSAVSALLFFIFGLVLAPWEMLTGLALLALFMIPFRQLGKAINLAGQGSVREWETFNASLLSGLKNHFLLSVYRRTEPEINEGHRRLETYYTHVRSQSAAYATTSVYPLMVGIFIIATLTSLALKMTGTPAMTLVSFFYVFIRFAQAASEMNSNWSMVRFHYPAFQRLHSFLKQEDSRLIGAVNVKTGARPLDKIQQVRFDGVAFQYGPKPLFEEVSASLPGGKTLAIIGESGSGKSTLLSLLFGLLRPSSGQVLINEMPLEQIGTSFYEQVGYVGPEPFLLEASIRDNLLFGHPRPESIRTEDMWTALSNASLENEIRHLDGQLDHYLKDSHRLSTGQKQRLSIARACLRNPSLFVFDEGTANLDIQTEQKIISNLHHAFPQSIFIFVTHRRDLAATADIKIQLGPA